MEIREMIGSRIRDIRTKKGLTQDELAEEMGINPKYLSGIERGKENPTMTTLINLAKALGVPIAEVFDFTETEGAPKMKARITEMLKDADEGELKKALKILSAILY